MLTTIKSAGYAYPTSTTAKKLGCASVGCFYVEEKRDELDHVSRKLHGPFDTLETANVFGEALPLAWSRYTKRAQVAA